MRNARLKEQAKRVTSYWGIDFDEPEHDENIGDVVHAFIVNEV